MQSMKKQHAIKVAGSIKNLADILGLSFQAVFQWKENVPELRVYQLNALRPDLFSKPMNSGRRAKDRRSGATDQQGK